MDQIFDIAVIGGGIVGIASAYKLQEQFPGKSIAVVEKEKALADHQTGNNSGVIHSGIYYKPGSYKARNCVQGRREIVAFAQKYGVKHDICGKVIVATDKNELPHMDRIFNNGIQNEVEGIEKIDAGKIREIEPHCHGIAGLWVPCTGIIDFRGATQKMGQLMEAKNVESKIFLGYEVKALERGEEQSSIITNRGTIKARKLIFCAGLQADRMARKDSVSLDMRVVGFRGDYYELTDQAKHKVRNLIYPVPNPQFPFLGVHFTRMTNGDIECGPNAVFVFKREGYKKTDFNLTDTREALGFAGTWKFFAKHWKFGIDEYRRAFSKRLFLSRLQRLIPDLEMGDLKPGRAGVRAMALGADGQMIDDFKIEYRHNSIHVLNAPSPAATACLAIGEEVKKMAVDHFGLE